VLADQRLVDVDIVLVDVVKRRPVLVVDFLEHDRDLVDDLVRAFLLDLRLDDLPLIGLYVLRGEALPDEIHPALDHVRIRRCAVLPEQELDNKDRHAVGGPQDAEQILSNDEARKRLGRLFVEIVERDCLDCHTPGLILPNPPRAGSAS
jgi:hypothetical protein